MVQGQVEKNTAMRVAFLARQAKYEDMPRTTAKVATFNTFFLESGFLCPERKPVSGQDRVAVFKAFQEIERSERAEEVELIVRMREMKRAQERMKLHDSIGKARAFVEAVADMFRELWSSDSHYERLVRQEDMLEHRHPMPQKQAR